MKVNFTIDGETVLWKEIPGFENYLASSDGRIYSKTRNKELAQTETKDGYLKVSLYKNGKGTTKKTHVFIAMAFIPNPDNKPQVNHIDYNKKNNNIKNLEWVTQKENMKHALKNNRLNTNAITENKLKLIEKIGRDAYLEMCRKHGSMADGKKGAKTREQKYGKEYLDNMRKKATLAAAKANGKKTEIFKDGERLGVFNSIKEAADYLGSRSENLHEAIRLRGGRYKGYEVVVLERSKK